MKIIFSRFKNNNSGATAIEYALIASFIAIAIISGATLLGGSLDETFNSVAGLMQTAD